MSEKPSRTAILPGFRAISDGDLELSGSWRQPRNLGRVAVPAESQNLRGQDLESGHLDLEPERTEVRRPRIPRRDSLELKSASGTKSMSHGALGIIHLLHATYS